MLKYEVRRLEDIVNNLDNKRKPLNDQERKEITQYGLYPYCGANGIVDYVDKYLLDEEILCIAEDGSDWSFNKKCSYIMNEKCWVNNHAHVVTAKKGIILKYLYYYLNYSDLSSKVTGTTRGKMTKSALNSIEIPIPDYDMQGRIVVILDKTQDLIDKRNQQIQACDEVIKSQFIEIFGDPVINPMGWEMPKIEQVVANEKNALKAGPFGSALKKEYYVEQGYKLYGQEQVISGDANFGDYYISEEKYKELENCAVKANDVLISLVGTYGKILIMPNEFEAGIINPRLMKITFDKEKVNTVYFKYFFGSNELKRALSHNTHGGTMDILNLGIVRNIKIPVPPIELQNEFSEFVQQVDKLKFGMEQSLKRLEANFDALMQKAFKGELF